jgi:signal peptidase I
MRTWFRDNRGFLVFLLCFGCFRTAVADWNPIPSGSMRPTLLEGDVVLVNRLAYDVKLPLTDVVLAPLAEPRRGDVVTFTSPLDGTRLIKRLVGLPGDVVALRDGVLHLNGVAATYLAPEAATEPTATGLTLPALRATEQWGDLAHPVQFLPTVAAAQRNYGPVQVPAGHYFMLGDNRDNSADSRFIGMVPRQRLIGRAHHLLVSADILDRWQPRLGRWGAEIR